MNTYEFFSAHNL